MDKKLGKNLILNTSYNILAILVPFVTAPYLGRVLGAAQVGCYTYNYSIASYFIMFGLLGIINYGTRSIAQVRESEKKRSKIFSEIYFMQLITGGIITIVYLIYSFFSFKTKSYSILMLPYVMTSVLDVSWFCIGMEKFKSIVLRNIFIKIINIIFIFTLVKNEDSLLIYILIMVVCYFISALILWPSVLNEVSFIKPKLKEIIKHFKPNFILFIPAISASVFQIMDKIMIGIIANNSQLAYYEYADKIIQVPNVIFGAIGAVMLSRMSYMVKNYEDQGKNLLFISMELSFLISVGFCFGIMAIADELVLVYYGNRFIQSGRILFLLAPSIVLYGFNNVLRMQYIIPRSKDSIYIKATMIGAAINIVLNFIFIPRYASMGAIIGTISAQIAILFVYYIFLRKEINILIFFKKASLIFFSGVIMFGTIKILRLFHGENIVTLIIDLVFGIFVYSASCLVSGIFNKNQLLNLYFNKIIRKDLNGSK